MSDIPLARKRLNALELHIKRELRLIRKLMTRPAPIRRAKNHSAKLTPALAEEIRTYATKYPSKPYRAIARHFNVDDGRVSEAVRELR